VSKCNSQCGGRDIPDRISLLFAHSVSEKLLLLEQLLEITSFDDVDEDDASLRRRGPASDADTDGDTDDDDDGFDNFERVVRSQRDGSAEACAMLERATQLLIRLDLEFLDGVDIPSVQVRALVRTYVNDPTAC
jgi:hypothetical protein